MKNKKAHKVHALKNQERTDEGALVLEVVLVGKVSLVHCVLYAPLYN